MVHNASPGLHGNSQFQKWMQNEEKKARLREKSDTLTEAGLHKALNEKLTGYCWRLRCHPTGMDGAQEVDIVGRPESQELRDVFIEVERRRGHPIDNVVKTWRYIEENAASKPVCLIQVFSFFYDDPDAETEDRRRMKEAIFVGRQAEQATKKLRYEPLGHGYWPPCQGGTLDTLTNKIASLITNERGR